MVHLEAGETCLPFFFIVVGNKDIVLENQIQSEDVEFN
jgi:hypothetical protein